MQRKYAEYRKKPETKLQRSNIKKRRICGGGEGEGSWQRTVLNATE